jgi:hypothetical protein
MSTGCCNTGNERRNLMLPSRKIQLNEVCRQTAAAFSFLALAAATLLLCAAPGMARADAAPADASGASTTVTQASAKKPVSPYAIAARRHFEQLAAAKTAPQKNAAGQAPSALRPAHARHH